MEPGLIEIRPLRINEIVGAALRALFKNPAGTLAISLNFAMILGFFSLAAIYLSPSPQSLNSTLNQLSTSSQPSPEQLEALFNALLPTLTVVVFLTLSLYFFQGIVSGIIAPAVGFLITGNKLSRNETWLRTKPLIGKLFLLSLVIMIFLVAGFLGPIFLALLISSIFSPVVASFILSITLIFSVGLLIAIWTSLLLAPCILVIENTSIRLSLIRSRTLVKKNFARIFFGTIWATIMAQALALLVQLPFSIISQIFTTAGELTTASVFIETVGAILGYTLILAFFASYLALLYTDQRIRHENLAENLKSARG
jgi:hypothetical protein